jgi:hypothetical protein
MQQYLIYFIIAAAAVIVVFIVSFAVARAKMAQYRNSDGAANGGADARQPARKPSAPRTSSAPGVYEAPGVNQASDHPLGAVQSVIRGRVRFVPFGLLVICVALFGLYELYIAGATLYFTHTALNMAAFTVISAAAVVWGFRLISYATYRVRLRRKGFEIASVFGVKAYEYKELQFHLDYTIEHKYAGEGYRPVVMKTKSFNMVWVCQVLFRDGRRPLVLKSSRYAWLKNKIRAVKTAVEGDES